MTIDTACSSSAYAFECAYKSIRNGECDAAIVCAASVGLSPKLTRMFFLLGILDPNGMNRPFDADCNI